MVKNVKAGDATLAAVRKLLSDKQVLDLTMLIGLYMMVQPVPGNDGCRAGHQRAGLEAPRSMVNKDKVIGAPDEIAAAPFPDAHAYARSATRRLRGGAHAVVGAVPGADLHCDGTSPAANRRALCKRAGGAVFSIGGLHIDGPFFGQLIATMPSFGLIVGGAPTGWLIDRLGIRRVLIGALLMFALFGSAGLYIEDPALLLLSRFGLGFAAVAVGAATISLLGARFAGAARARIPRAGGNILGGVVGVWIDLDRRRLQPKRSASTPFFRCS